MPLLAWNFPLVYALSPLLSLILSDWTGEAPSWLNSALCGSAPLPSWTWPEKTHNCEWTCPAVKWVPNEAQKQRTFPESNPSPTLPEDHFKPLGFSRYTRYLFLIINCHPCFPFNRKIAMMKKQLSQAWELESLRLPSSWHLCPCILLPASCYAVILHNLCSCLRSSVHKTTWPLAWLRPWLQQFFPFSCITNFPPLPNSF